MDREGNEIRVLLETLIQATNNNSESITLAAKNGQVLLDMINLLKKLVSNVYELNIKQAHIIKEHQDRINQLEAKLFTIEHR